jgi:O-succinylbenzoate synthase
MGVYDEIPRGDTTVAPPAPRLVGVELVQLDLDLLREIGTSGGTHGARPLLLARVVTDQSEGWGECGALPEGTPVDPPLDAVRRWAVERAVPRLLEACAARAGAVPEAALASTMRGESGEDRLAGAMLEMALLDAELRTLHESLGSYLGATQPAVAVGAMVGIPPSRDLGALLDAVDDALDPERGGARRLRLKIAPGWDVGPVKAVRARYPALALQVDANGAYEPAGDGDASAARLGALEPFGLDCIEQPFSASDLVSHAELAARLETPVCLDESLLSVRHVEQALRYQAMDVACLKPARLGGLAAAVEACKRCASAGVPAFVGGLFESGLGRSANVALAGVRGFSLPGDLSAPDRYLNDSPFSYPQVADGQVRVPQGAGVGSTVRPEVLERRAVWREWAGARAT